MQISSQNVKAIFLALVAFLCYSVADSILKQTTNYYDTGFAGLVITTIHLFLLLFAIPFLGGFKPIAKPDFFILNIIRGVFATACWLFFIIGMQYNDLAVNYSVLLSASIWVALFSVIFLKSKLGLQRWCAIIIGFIGVLIVIQPAPSSFEITSLLPLVSAFAFAGCQMITRFIGVSEKQSTILFYTSLLNVIGALIYTLFVDSWQPIEMTHLPIFTLAALVYLIGNLLAVKAFMIGNTEVVSPTQYSQIIWGALIGFFFFAEVPTFWTIIGASLIVLSGIYIIYREHKAEKT